MNSGMAISDQSFAIHPRGSRLALILTTIYIALLVALGILMLMLEPADALYEVFPLGAAFFPAAIYATAMLFFRRDLFAEAEPARRSRAWPKLLRISAILYCLLPVEVILFCLFGASLTMTVRLQDVSLREFEAFMQRAVIFMHGPWKTLIVSVMGIVLVALCARVGRAALDERERLAEWGLPGRRRVGLWMAAGGAMMLGSLALDVGYSSSGWSVLTWQGGWVTNEFVAPYSLAPWIGSILFGGYAGGVVLAPLALAYAVMVLRGKAISPGKERSLVNLGLLVAWFALTSYWGDCLYMAFIGLLGTSAGGKFVAITVGWLTMFVLGAVLWFRYGGRPDARGSRIRTGLLVWALPLMLLPLITFWCAAAWWLYGLILYMAGVQIVAACCWKVWNDRIIQA